jgi:hypothetical protein
MQGNHSLEGLEDRRLLSGVNFVVPTALHFVQALDFNPVFTVQVLESTVISGGIGCPGQGSQGSENTGPATTTYSALQTSDPAAAAGLAAIAPSGVTLSASQQIVISVTTFTGYSAKVTDSSGNTTDIAVDQNGLPAGTETVLLSQLQAGPANDQAIAAGLQALAPTGVTIAGTQEVDVSTMGVGTPAVLATTFTVNLTNSNGTVTKITVDSSGKLVLGPTTTFAQLQTANAAAAAGLQALAPIGVTIASTQTVKVTNVNSTTTDYSVKLTDSSGNTVKISVDENGLPTGNETVTYGELQAGPANDQAIATGIQALAPTGTTIAATQDVDVITANGVTTFKADVTASNGTVTEIIVNSAGQVVLGPHATFGQLTAVDAAAATGLQALAPTGVTLSSSQSVTVQTVNTTTTYYSVNVANSTGKGHTTLTVDENGLPVGNTTVMFSQLQAGPAAAQAIATALQSLAPTGVTIAATQAVFVTTTDDATVYSIDLANSNGTTTEIAVNSSGTVTTPPASTSQDEGSGFGRKGHHYFSYEGGDLLVLIKPRGH